MAKQKDNVVTHGLSGKIGDLLVFSQRDGKTIVSKIARRKKKKATPKQKAQRKRFQRAIIYSKFVVKSAKGQVYKDAAAKREGLSASNIAVADFLHAPDIENVDLSTYTGKIGDEIRVEATDDFEVEAVHVEISGADGSIIEEGDAVKNEIGIWIYTATTDNKTVEGNRIVITASDLPGNLTTEEVNL
jgi:hypothetical protein